MFQDSIKCIKKDYGDKNGNMKNMENFHFHKLTKIDFLLKILECLMYFIQGLKEKGKKFTLLNTSWNSYE